MRRLVLLFALMVAAPVVASAEPPKTHEIIYTKPSGFWTSNRPAAAGHEYRWRLLLIGVMLVVVTGYGTIRLVRRANADRAKRIGQLGNPPDRRDD